MKLARIGPDKSQGHELEPSESRPKLTERQREQVEEFVRQEGGDLHRYACSKSLAHFIEPLDLVQTTFQEAVREWQKISKYTPEERRRWLRSVLRNKASDLSRKQKVRDRNSAMSAAIPQSVDPSEHAEYKIALTRCWEEIKKMPPMRQEIASLVWGASQPPSEVAELLGIAPSTVRGHLLEARKQLRAIVGPLVSFIDDEEEQE